MKITITQFIRSALPVTLLLLTACGGGSGGGSAGSGTTITEGLMGGSIQANPLLISGIVSTPIGTYNGTDGAVAGARFKELGVLARAADTGDVYMADACMIRIVDGDDYVHTLAGKRQDCSISDGDGTAAGFEAIGGMVTGTGYVYMTDRNSVRRMLRGAPYTVDTIAGTATLPGSNNGPGLVARFSSPQGVAVQGNLLFVADTGNHTLRIVDLSNANHDVSILAGTAGLPGNTNDTGSNARLEAPTALVRCGTKLYFADGHGARIRSVDLQANYGLVSAVAGGAVGSTDGDGAVATFGEVAGLACNATNTLLYVADLGNNRIRTVDLGTPALTVATLAGDTFGETDGTGTAAQFAGPTGIVSNGTILIVADKLGGTLRQVGIAGGAVSTYGGTTRWKDGTGVAAAIGAGTHVTSDGKNLYIADVDNSVIRRIVIATGEVSTLAGAPGVVGSVDGTGAAARFSFPFAITTDGINLYVTEPFVGHIRKVNIASGKVTTLAAGLFLTAGITTDNKDLYVTVPTRNVVYKVAMSGVVSVFAGKEGEAGDIAATRADTRFTSPNAITTDGKSLYLSDDGLHKVVELSLTQDNVALFFAGGGSTSMITDGKGLFLSAGAVVARLDIITKAPSIVAGHVLGYVDDTGTGASFGGPMGLTSDGASLFVYDGVNGVVRRIQ